MALFDFMKPRILFAGTGTYANVQEAGNRDTSPTLTYGEYTLPNNRFSRYQMMTEIDPYVWSGLNELSLALGKGYEIALDPKFKEDFGGDGKDMLTVAQDFSDDVDGERLFCESGRLLPQDGLCVAVLSTADSDAKDDGILNIEFAPMPYTTLLPRGYEPSKAKPGENFDGNRCLTGPVDRVYINEGQDASERMFKEDRFVLMRNAYQNYEVADNLQRPTIGLYGRSLLTAIEGTVRYRQNLLYCNDKATKRYGTMLLHYDYTALSKLIEERKISLKDAQTAMDLARQNGLNMKAGQDIWTSGWEVDNIETTGNYDIVPTKQSLEVDIINALLGTQAAMGQSAGTTFASAYVAQRSKVMAMESLRKTLQRGWETVLQRHLIYRGFGKKAKYIRIKLDPIVEPDILVADIIALNQSGKLKDEDMYDVIGWNFQPPTKEEQLAAQEEQLKMQAKYAPRPANGAKGETQNAPGGAKTGVKAQKKAYD